jgi:Cu+-exporting ATPase
MHAHANAHARPDGPAGADTAEFAVSRFAISGMNCNNCARHVTEAIQGVPGVVSADVQLEEGGATVHWNPGADRQVEQVVRAVRAAGYDAAPVEEVSGHSHPPAPSPMAEWKFTVTLGMVLTSPLIIGEWVFGLGASDWFKWVGFAFSAPVMLVCGGRFFRGAWNQIKHGRSNMDTLVALGSSTAFGYSLWGLLSGWHGHLYFMEAAAIITLISAGHFVEALVSARAAGSLRALMNLAPQTARKLGDNGTETEAAVATLRAGERVVLKPGDRVPTDGDVSEGSSAVDESMLTGESLPVDKAAGAKLYAGTVNQNGRLVMRVTATGKATALAQIIAVVQRAQNSRANIQKLGDSVSNVFVPVVVLVALATGLWWGLAYPNAVNVSQSLTPYLWPVHFPPSALAAAFVQAAAVLIVACPCAMGLATPAAIMAGTNAAARRGILIRDGLALEKSGTITAVLFDKTGTLTLGKPSVVAMEDLREKSDRTLPLETIAAALARPSNHPLSRAVAGFGAAAAASPGTSSAPSSAQAKASRRLPTAAPEGWSEVRGKGVEGKWPDVSTAQLRLGSLTWLRESGVPVSPSHQKTTDTGQSSRLPPGHRAADPSGVETPEPGGGTPAPLPSGTAPTDRFINDWSAQGATILGLAAGARLIGLFALRDTLKPHAAGVVDQLARGGKATFLITGDNQRTAAAIAKLAGIGVENVFAEIRPEQKAEIVAQLQRRGQRVAFVGDGINDAPALEQADLGVAVAQASDVAREAADIILLKSDIQAIPEALGLAQATLRTIKQNLFWAFFYNAAAVPLAALGFLSPVVCAAAMGVSDLIVIGNALRLRRWKPSGGVSQ